MYHHPAYPFPAGQWALRMGAKYFTRLSAFGARQKLAISLYEAKNRPRLAVMPPLLRGELFDLPLDRQGTFFFGILTEQGVRSIDY